LLKSWTTLETESTAADCEIRATVASFRRFRARSTGMAMNRTLAKIRPSPLKTCDIEV